MPGLLSAILHMYIRMFSYFQLKFANVHAKMLIAFTSLVQPYALRF